MCAAGAILLIENQNVMTGIQQVRGGGKTRDACSQDDDGFRWCRERALAHREVAAVQSTLWRGRTGPSVKMMGMCPRQLSRVGGRGTFSRDLIVPSRLLDYATVAMRFSYTVSIHRRNSIRNRFGGVDRYWMLLQKERFTEVGRLYTSGEEGLASV